MKIAPVDQSVKQSNIMDVTFGIISDVSQCKPIIIPIMETILIHGTVSFAAFQTSAHDSSTQIPRTRLPESNPILLDLPKSKPVVRSYLFEHAPSQFRLLLQIHVPKVLVQKPKLNLFMV